MDKNQNDVVQIDENNLDKECIRLPSDYLKYAHQAAEAKRDADEIKAELDVITAESGNAIRVNPAAFGLQKITESAIDSSILLIPRYQTALKRLQDARHTSEMSQAVVWALEHKKQSLKLLVELHGMGYFSSAKLSERGKDAVEKMTQSKVRKNRFRDED